VADRSEIGEILARAADEGEPRARLHSPEVPPRCTACAFTRGTPANNTLETVLDAFGCTLEDVPFMCHQHFDDAGRPVNLCSGWVFARESRAALRSPTGETSAFPPPGRDTAAQELIHDERSAGQEKDRDSASRPGRVPPVDST
jgi:hypothetical protein